MNDSKDEIEPLVKAQFVRWNPNLPRWMRFVFGFLVAGLTGLALYGLSNTWDRLPWSAVAQQNRANMKVLHGTIKPGDPFQTTLDQLAALPGYHVRDERNDPIRDLFGLRAEKEPGVLDIATIEALPSEILLSDLRLYIAAMDDTIVGVGLRMSGERRIHMDDCPPDQVDKKYIEAWEAAVGYSP
jgi:hypothetical protein